MIYARKNNKMPEFYTILPEKIVFARIWGAVAPLLPPHLLRLCKYTITVIQVLVKSVCIRGRVTVISAA